MNKVKTRIKPKVEDINGMKKVTMYDGLVVYVDNNMNIISIHNNILKQKINNKGYLQVYIQQNGSGHPRLVHRIIAQAFLEPNLDDKYEVHHKDHNPLNNSLDNLEPLLRYDHKIEHLQKYPLTKFCVICGKEFTPHKTKRKRAKTCSPECAKIFHDTITAIKRRRPINQYTKDGKLVKEWEYGMLIEKETGFYLSNINKCCNDIIHSVYGYIWRYAD